jgi:mannosyltransferase OCH1-like enzyme
MQIPRLIHQTYSNFASLNENFQENMVKLANLNPNWEMKFYSDDDILDFIRTEYDESVLKSYLSINPKYGAARADLFRYLVVHKCGGLYLDIKSTATLPLDSVIQPNDYFICSNWPDSIDGVDTSLMGVHEELGYEEYQNWYVCAAPETEVLEKVIQSVCQNIAAYRPIRNGVGGIGVLRTTGPIAYSKIVHQYVLSGQVRLASNSELGFVYSIYKFGTKGHHPKNSKHYGLLSEPVVYRPYLHSLCIRYYFLITKFWEKTKRAIHKITRL